MEVFKYSAKGNRHTNDDFLLDKQLPDGGSLVLLADGMGGYQHGDLASSLACTTIAEYLSAHTGKGNISASIELAVKTANEAIGQQRSKLKEKLGTTLAGALVLQNTAFFFWLGDVRIYHFRENKIVFQSEDHSLVNDLKKQGTVSAADIVRYRNIVTRSLMGDNFQDKIPVVETQILQGDTIVLCSDGLWQNWNITALINQQEDELKTMLSENESTNDDNYSMIRIHVGP